MRIAHVTDCYLPRLGGIEVQIRDLAAQQIAAGHHVTVLTPTRPGSPELEATAIVPVHRLAPSGRFGPVCAVSRIADVLAGGRFDVVHAHSSVISPVAWAATRSAAQLGIPAVLTLHSMLSSRALALTAADRATGWSTWPVAWTAVSSAAAAPLRTVLGHDQVAVLPNGVDPSFWATAAPRPARPVVTIASVMRLSRRKRPFALLAILRRIRDLTSDRIDLRAVIVGDGPQRGPMERILRAQQLDSWVTLTGALHRRQVRDVLLSSDLYLAPAIRESFGIAALEARSSGLPVIATASGGVGEFIQDGQDGYLTGSDLEMAVVASRLLASPRLRIMQERNRRTAIEMPWPAVVARTEDIYARAAARDRAGVQVARASLAA